MLGVLPIEGWIPKFEEDLFMRNHLFATAAVSAALLFSAGTASATVFPGPFVGDTVTYSDVQDQDNLFGAPTLTGDTLSFTPQGFNAESQNLAFDFQDGFLSTLITSNTGAFIESFTLTEAGAYRLDGVGGAGTSATSVTVDTVFAITVLGVDSGPGAGTILVADAELFTADLSAGAVGGAWIGSTEVNIAALAADAGITGNITQVRLTLDNQLTAISEDGTFAFIDKKGVSAVSITVPEPSSALLVLGAGALLLRRRIAG